MKKWVAANMASQTGRIAVITGTGGLALEDAFVLADKGATVILAGRNGQKGADAIRQVRQRVPGADIAFEQLDLADLASVERFAARLASQQERIDMLINNAGVMVPPQRQVTADGFELQWGTNYLGHFALTARLLPLLQRGKARVVTLSSVAARAGRIDFDDLQSQNAYKPMETYAQSKLACLMFALELQRQSVAAGWGVTSIAAHPGVSRTDLLHNAPGKRSANGLARTYLWFLFQPAWQGALPTLYAATDPAALPGGYYGPHALAETRGYPAPARMLTQALDRDVAARLWQRSQIDSALTFADFAQVAKATSQ